MKKFLLYVILSINIFALDFYLGGGLALDENDSNIPRIFILEAEIVKSMKLMDLGFGLAYEGNYSPSTSPREFSYKSFDAVPFYFLVRGKLPLKKFQPFWFIRLSDSDIIYHGKEKWFIHEEGTGSYSRIGLGFIRKDKIIELSLGDLMFINYENEQLCDSCEREPIYHHSKTLALTIKKNIK